MNVIETIKNNYYALHGEYPNMLEHEVVPLNGISQEIAETYTDPALVKNHLAQWKRDLKASPLRLGDIVKYKGETQPKMIVGVSYLINHPPSTPLASVCPQHSKVELVSFEFNSFLVTEKRIDHLKKVPFKGEEVLPLIEWKKRQKEVREWLLQGCTLRSSDGDLVVSKETLSNYLYSKVRLVGAKNLYFTFNKTYTKESQP
jgi:hypothetical protein